MQTFSAAEIEAQAVLDLPERELLAAVITITCNNLDISVLENLLNGSFNNWSISALDGNTYVVNVSDNVNQDSVNAFCDQVGVALSAQCYGSLTGGIDP